ncbi:glutamate synthase small subunit [Rubrobacter marinus]|uniref:Glutamate synthase small subunit n=1 Tax=Rubrobacter marinus TaxID=2653852 RepID=A0A6G8Q1S6_9ACTN|nr:glutamate synthase subunit beta [Rubrobacter marinus]QIN80416.1 glutamate synthase small subunit [Rubrobacter marinus]
MGDPKGFLKIGRKPTPKRNVVERIQDYRYVYDRMPEEELREQASRCMDCGVPFCNTGCPLGNLIPDWNDLVYRDSWRRAIDRLHLTNNFPEFTGMLCPAPCESACVLAINDKPVTIKEIELSIINRAFDEGWVKATPPPPEARTGKKVAIVGSGPAGLAAAQQLNRAGHSVTVFEKDDRIGGLLRYGIPDYKIEKWVVDRRVAIMEEEGIEFRTNAHVGVDPTTEGLKADFDAVVLAVGALQGRDLDVPGRELKGVHLAMDYLTQQNRRVMGLPIEEEEISAAGKNVVILGGGDTSADCLGNSHREGAASVKVLTHGPKPPENPDHLTWPDWPLILHTYPAHEEGGERGWSVAVTGFSGSDGKVERMHAIQTERKDGKTEYIEGSEHEIECDLVLLAIGFTGPVRDTFLDDLALGYNERGAIPTANGGFATEQTGLFVAGDAKRGASLIVWAIAEGRKAAREADEYLMGRSLLPG